MKNVAPGENQNGKALLLGSVVIFVITLVAYLPAIRAGFIWDDDDMLTQNPLVQSPSGLWSMWNPWAKDNFFDFIPLTLTSFWLEWRLWHFDAMGYHVTNVLLHATTAIFFWRALKYLKIPGAWLIGMIFAIHPVNVQSVAWITERKNTLALVFYALSLLWYLRWENEKSEFQRHAAAKQIQSDSQLSTLHAQLFYWLALGAFVLGLLSKGAIVMLPFVLLGCIWWLRNKITKKDFINTLPFFLASMIFAVVTIWFQYGRSISTDASVVQANSFAIKLANAGVASWFYFLKTVLPRNLMFVYPRWNFNASDLASYIPGTLLLLCLFVFWFFRKRWGRPFLFGVGYFVVTLFPVLGFFKIYFQKYSFVADYWQYPSIIGLIALVIGGAAFLLQAVVHKFSPPAVAVASRPTKEKKSKPQMSSTGRVLNFFGGAVAVGLIAVLGTLTWKQCHIYANEETLWLDEVGKNPACWLAQHNYASLLLEQWKREQGAREPDKREGDKLFRAAIHDRQALRVKPDHTGALYNLAFIAIMENRTDEAIQHLRAAIQIQPDMLLSLHMLAWILSTDGNPKIRNGAEAVQIAKAALAVAGDNDAEALETLACALAESGNFPAAVETARKALSVATASGQSGTVNELQVQIGFFERGRAYHER